MSRRRREPARRDPSADTPDSSPSASPARPLRPPRLGRWLVRRLCAPGRLEVVEGDIEELYRARARRHGRVRATLRYLSDVISLARLRASRSLRGAPGPDPELPSRHTDAPFPEVLVDRLLQDLRFASRSLRQAPGFTVVVVLTLALGIGANSAIFSVVNGVLLRPLPYPEPGRIVQLEQFDPDRDSPVAAVSGSVFRGLREGNSVFESMAMYTNQNATLTGVDQPVRLTGLAATPELFPLLRVQPLHGRTFSAEEGDPGNDQVVLLSHRGWQRYFGGDPEIVGERILLDDAPRIVVGVMPSGFEFPEPGIDYWVPMVVRAPERQELDDGVVAFMEFVAPAIARLADGATIEQAVAETTAYVRNFEESMERRREEARQRAAAGDAGQEGPGAQGPRRQSFVVGPGGGGAAGEEGPGQGAAAGEGAAGATAGGGNVVVRRPGGGEQGPGQQGRPGAGEMVVRREETAGPPPESGAATVRRGPQPADPGAGESEDGGQRRMLATAGGGADGPGGTESGMRVVPLQERIVGDVRPSLLILMGAVGFVLLIACANVANLVLARSTVRTRETAVRAAVGAGGWQLVRLLLVEGLLLALAGGALGLFLAWGGLRVLMASPPEFIPRVQEIALDTSSLLFTLAAAGLTGLLFSLLPARNAVRLDLTRALREGTGGFDPAGRLGGRAALRKVLVAAEIALSVVLLVGAGLLISSFVRLATVDPGFAPDNLLSLQLQPPSSSVPDREALVLLQDRIREGLGRVPGVQSVATAVQTPGFSAPIRIAIRTERQEQERPDAEPVPVGVHFVGDGYFETIGARLLDGRWFGAGDRDGSQPVAVMSRAAAEGMFPGVEALGQRMTFFGGEAVEVVGIVEDIREAGVDPEPQPEIFIPFQQMPSRLAGALGRGPQRVLVRTGPAPLRVLPALRARLADLVFGAPAVEASTVRDLLADEIAEPRFYAALVGAFAALALVLAAVGIYGVLSYSVQQQVQETAIRRALGAQPGEVLVRVVRQGMVVAVVGLALGLAGAVAVSRVLEAMLYEIRPTDPVTYVAVALVFLVVSLVAVWLPARRAMRIDPMRVLRFEA